MTDVMTHTHNLFTHTTSLYPVTHCNTFHTHRHKQINRRTDTQPRLDYEVVVGHSFLHPPKVMIKHIINI